MRFVLGIAMGFLVGTMIAPRSGEETRDLLTEKAEEIARGSQRRVQESIRDVARTSEKKAGEIGSEVGKKAAEEAVRSVTEELLGNKQSSKRA